MPPTNSNGPEGGDGTPELSPDEIWNILDADQSGTVDQAELKNTAQALCAAMNEPNIEQCTG